MDNPSDYWVHIRGTSARLESERKELLERENICWEESVACWDNWEWWNRGLVNIENAEYRIPFIIESEHINRPYIAGEEDLAWQRLASKFMQIGIPRRHTVLAGAVCRCSPTVDSRKTLRQLKEGQDVLVEEVAGNWARISSPVKGWVWRTHLKPSEHEEVEFEEDTVDTPATGSFAETPGHSTPNLDSLAESRGVDSINFIDDIYDSDSLCGLRPTIQQHQSIGSKTGSHTYSDNERRSISSDFSSIMENFRIGESVAIRDTIDQPWLYGKVCRTLNGTVLIQRNGFAGMTSWRHVKRVPMQKGMNTAESNDKVKMITIKKNGKEERIGLEIDHSKLTVSVVAEESPAKRAGMKTGMKIRSICGMNVSTILDVRALLKQSGMELDVGVCSDECSISESDSQGSGSSIIAPVSPLQATSGVLGLIRGDGYACLPPPIGSRGGGWCWPVEANHSIATRFGFTPDIYFHWLSLPEPTKKLLLILFKRCTEAELPAELFGTITHYIKPPTNQQASGA
eukprot:TRINITY_DN395_c5_g1_i1.p1 TRINITY_DN395_c5_g1~~TRINITY_DN395_c5_g1_i1.p1  ORF type:complete len:514 (+),score=84.50 TRINITY_DN395_c5_g1_i1:34-1575(+)